ncbi:replication-associated recombination protein A [bacterium]|nr:MAG: replication-associated recombination protein A [bacterium]
MDLFAEENKKSSLDGAPLAERMRPASIKEFAGQAHIVGPGKLLDGVLKKKKSPSLILWGPPGTGKTTLARIVAGACEAEFIQFSAVLSGVKEIREVIKAAGGAKARGKNTVLFVDEIHRFNKAQQDAFLHSVEDGTITLIGATTENPSFEINSPLLSRCTVLVLEALSDDAIKEILKTAIASEKGLGGQKAVIEKGVVDFMASSAHGDARSALNCLEAAFMISDFGADGVTKLVNMNSAIEAIQKKALLYDKSGEEHYNVISAFIKSMRGTDPDAALYWLARMITAGEAPLFIARRMVIFASEDIGNADPRALSVALGVKDAVDFVGMPEGFIPLAHGVSYLASAPKSNASYKAYLLALEDVKKHGSLGVPMHIRNAPTRLMKELGYGKGYKYPHDCEGAVTDDECLPDKLKGSRYYRPSDRGFEKNIAENLKKKGKL